MIRAVLPLILFAGPAMAQVADYPGMYTRGGLPFRPYVNTSTYVGNYLPSQFRYLYPPASPNFPASRSASYPRPPLATPAIGLAGYRYFPNYPSLNSPRIGLDASGNATIFTKQPLPFTAPLPVENACDPYMDDDGCLSEMAGL